MTSPYDIGRRLALTKLALFEPPLVKNVYRGPPRTAPMDATATGYYDQLREFVKQRRIEQGFDTFDRKTGFSDDNRTDMASTPAQADGSMP